MYHFLSACKRIEEISCQLYQLLANERTFSGEIRKTFKRLSDDERAHASQINLLLQANAKELKALRAISDAKINETLEQAERMLCQVMEEKLSEEMALQLAVKMEQQFVDVHVHNAVKFDSRKLAELFEKLGNEDQTHINVLKECLK